MPPTTQYKGKPCFHAPDAAVWRSWLEANHRVLEAVWLIIYKKGSGIPSVYYPEAVDQALCFGWVDSVANKRDADSYYQYFARRKPRSSWSRINKEKAARLMAAGLMAPAGLEMIELAKRTGTWTALDDVENGLVPEDLKAALEAQPGATDNWNNFARSVRRGQLELLNAAKRPGTRANRIAAIVAKAVVNDNKL